MSHVVFVPFTGFRVREEEMRELGMSLPGFKQRAATIAELPALGLLTLADLLPESWTCSYHGASSADEDEIKRILTEQPDLVAVSALTASVEEAYWFCQSVREAGVPVVLGGLPVSVCVEDALNYSDAVVVGEGETVRQEFLADAARAAIRAFGRIRSGIRRGRPARRTLAFAPTDRGVTGYVFLLFGLVWLLDRG